MGDNGVPFVWDDKDEDLFPTPTLPNNLQPKRIRLSPESSDPQEGRSSSSQSSLLGLSLRKTPSFLNLVQRSLCKGKHAAVAAADDVVENNKSISINENKCPKKQDEKMKASNFPAFYMKIGKWQKVTRYEGDLTAKVYYAKKKLVWEVLDGALKSKIEIQWADISALRAFTPENEPGTLHIELQHPPMFFRELNPQPRKHTVWHQASDFTGGQAPIWRRHCVKFPPGVLDRHLEKLLLSDQRLSALTRSPFPSHPSPYFDPTMYGVSQLSLLLNNFESGSSNNPPPPTNPTLMPDMENPFTNVVGSSSQLQQQNCQNYQPNNVNMNAGVGVMQQFQFDQDEPQPAMQAAARPTMQAAVDEEVDQTMNSWLGMNPTTYYNGGNPNFQHEFTVAPTTAANYNVNNNINIAADQQAHHDFFPQHVNCHLPPPPQPQQEAHHDFFPQHVNCHIPPQPQQEAHHDFFPHHINCLLPPPQPQPQQEAQHDFFPQHINYSLPPPPQPQQEAHHDFFPQHINYSLPPPPQQEAQHDFFPQHINYQLPPPPQQEAQHDFFPQHVNYQLPPPPQPQQQAQRDIFPQHVNYHLPPPPPPQPQQHLGDDDVSLFMQQQMRNNNTNTNTNTNSFFTNIINPGSGPFF